MLRSRDDLQLEFVAETDFGSVITVEGHFFEDGEEIVLHQSIPAGGFPLRRAVLIHGAGDGGGFIEGAQEHNLLFGRSVREILAEESIALFVHIGEAAEEISDRSSR